MLRRCPQLCDERIEIGGTERANIKEMPEFTVQTQ
jgi:hypothetical protein